MTPDDVRRLRRCLELAAEARTHGDHPFGSLLTSGSGEVLAEHRNRVVTTRDVTAHPELTLARWSTQHLDDEQRRTATMYTSTEHCAMCAGALYWAGIGRVVFALSAEALTDLVPPGSSVLRLPLREVVSRGNHEVVVEGPCDELAAEAAAVHEGFWV